ncbi:MAG TPA: hypothetical protein P5297_07650, partial [Bacilli bacterium]|nr:hypothetical protein [Bacilli bacterium]
KADCVNLLTLSTFIVPLQQVSIFLFFACGVILAGVFKTSEKFSPVKIKNFIVFEIGRGIIMVRVDFLRLIEKTFRQINKRNRYSR